MSGHPALAPWLAPSRAGTVAVIVVALTGVAAAVVTVGDRGANLVFVHAQEYRLQSPTRQLEALIARTREPTAGGPGRRARNVRCVPIGIHGSDQRWRCSVRYPQGHTIRYIVMVDPMGRLHGSDATGARVLNGCCIVGRAGSG